MARPKERLSARQVQTAKATERPVLLADGGGLYLRVTPQGNKSWIYRYKIGARQRDMGLGPYPDIGLAEARDRAYQQRRLRLDGQDPLQERRGRTAAAAQERAKHVTLAEVAERCVAAREAGWRGTAQGILWRQSLRDYVFPQIGKLLVVAISTADIMSVLEPLWREKPVLASRIQNRLENVLDYATAHALRSGDNPGRWSGHLENLLAAPRKVAPVEHHAAMPYAELPALMALLAKESGPQAKGLEFAILCASRAGEVLGARWDEFDLKAKTWTIPGSRVKGGKMHRVPLSDRAAAIVEFMARGRVNDYVFANERYSHMGKTALAGALHRLGRSETVHGMRATFRTWAEERTNYPFEVREAALAHTVGDATERAYHRSDLFERRRRLMDDWAKYCEQPATAGEVVLIRSRAMPMKL
jgi:integrase